MVNLDDEKLFDKAEDLDEDALFTGKNKHIDDSI